MFKVACGMAEHQYYVTPLGFDPCSPCSSEILEAVYFTAILSSAVINTHIQRENKSRLMEGSAENVPYGNTLTHIVTFTTFLPLAD